MDNPWATAWDHPWHKADVAWPTNKAEGALWLQDDARWDPATGDAPSEPEDTTAQDGRGVSQSSEHRSAAVSDCQPARPTSPPRDALDHVPETTPGNVPPVASMSDGSVLETVLDHPDDDWRTAWRTTPSSGTRPKETQPLDQWEAARKEKEKLNRAVPPEFLDSLLRHCQQVSQEIWPASETTNNDNWRSSFDDHADIAALLAQLVPADLTLPTSVQFSATATAKAMNEALRLTRHLPASANSPLSRLLASKGSLEWEKAIKAKQDIVSDTAHVGWRVLEKDDRLGTLEESKQRKATSSGLLSFWNRRASAVQAAPVEIPSERSGSPSRSGLESAKPSHPPSSRAASPSKPSAPSVPPPPPTASHPAVVAPAPAPSAVSRFLNRFSLTKGPQHTSLAFSSHDLEFLSDIVPSANDPPDEDNNDSALDALTGVDNSSPLPPKLPPPISPPPRRPILSNCPSPAIRRLHSPSSSPKAFQMQAVNHASNIPILTPPLSPKPAASFSRTQSPTLSLQDAATPTVPPRQSSTLPVQQRLQSGSQHNSRPQSSFTISLSQKTPSLLSVPPLLPPPPTSPPQTPRLSTFPSVATPVNSSTMQSSDTSSFHGSYDQDDEFSAFASFPPSAAALFPSYPSQRSPSPPSPPARRTYERTHYPSSSSTSSTLSPSSQTSLNQLGSSVSAALDGFDDFISPPSVVQAETRKRSPSPPPLPVKPQFQHRQPPRVDTSSSRVYHTHTPSQTFASPTVHTSLMDSVFPVTYVSDAEHQRTQSLVNRAAARGGMLWPNSPDSDEPKVRAIPPPPSSSTSPKPSITDESFDLLGDGDMFSGGLEAFPTPLSVIGGRRTDSTVTSPATGTLHAPFGVGGGPGKSLGSMSQLQPSLPPLPSTTGPIPSFSSQGSAVPLFATNTGSLQPAKPKQVRGLSAQDLSFFEGL